MNLAYCRAVTGPGGPLLVVVRRDGNVAAEEVGGPVAPSYRPSGGSPISTRTRSHSSGSRR